MNKRKLPVSHHSSLFFIVCCSLFSLSLSAQSTNEAVQKGNEAYRKNDFAAAIKDYTKALQENGKNLAAKFNMGNALQRLNNQEKAAENYNDVITSTADADLKSKAYYNKALTMLQQKDLPGAIDAFKQALRILPNDSNTRENLQKALNEMKQQQQQSENNKKQQEEQNPQEKKGKKQQQPKMDKQMMEQKFKELQNQEKQLQKDLQRQKVNPQDQEKDW